MTKYFIRNRYRPPNKIACVCPVFISSTKANQIPNLRIVLNEQVTVCLIWDVTSPILNNVTMIIDEENGWTETRFIKMRLFVLKYVAGYVNLRVIFSIFSKNNVFAEQYGGNKSRSTFSDALKK